MRGQAKSGGLKEDGPAPGGTGPAGGTLKSGGGRRKNTAATGNGIKNNSNAPAPSCIKQEPLLDIKPDPDSALPTLNGDDSKPQLANNNSLLPNNNSGLSNLLPDTKVCTNLSNFIIKLIDSVKWNFYAISSTLLT